METKKIQGNVSTTGLSFRDIPSLFQRMIYNHFLPSRPCNASECRHNVQIYEVEFVWTNIRHPKAHTKECIKNIKEHCKKQVNVRSCKHMQKPCKNMSCNACGETLGVSWASLSGAVSSWLVLLSLEPMKAEEPVNFSVKGAGYCKAL